MAGRSRTTNVLEWVTKAGVVTTLAGGMLAISTAFLTGQAPEQKQSEYVQVIEGALGEAALSGAITLGVGLTFLRRSIHEDVQTERALGFLPPENIAE